MLRDDVVHAERELQSPRMHMHEAAAGNMHAGLCPRTACFHELQPADSTTPGGCAASSSDGSAKANTSPWTSDADHKTVRTSHNAITSCLKSAGAQCMVSNREQTLQLLKPCLVGAAHDQTGRGARRQGDYAHVPPPEGRVRLCDKLRLPACYKVSGTHRLKRMAAGKTKSLSYEG